MQDLERMKILQEEKSRKCGINFLGVEGFTFNYFFGEDKVVERHAVGPASALRMVRDTAKVNKSPFRAKVIRDCDGKIVFRGSK